jgi:DNA-directed RNA polymerase specialized sigma24 family protein
VIKRNIKTLSGESTIDAFLCDVESIGFRLAEFALKNAVDAMDVTEITVQKWVKKSSHKQQQHWQEDFFRILYEQIDNFTRQEIPLPRWFNTQYESIFLEDSVLDAKSIRSAEQAEAEQFKIALVNALGFLPLPQQQAFLLCYWVGFDMATIARMLNEAPIMVGNRCSSAWLGLHDALRPKITEPESETNLLEQIRETLNELVVDVSYVQQYQLRHIRLQALKQLQPKPIFRWMITTGVMALCLFTFWSLQVPQQIPMEIEFYSEEKSSDESLLAWKESWGLLDDMDFYLWLHHQQKIPVKQPLTEMPLSTKVRISKRNFEQWSTLSSERKGALKQAFKIFSDLPVIEQEALRNTRHAYMRLSVEKQKSIRDEWMALTEAYRESFRLQ